MSFVHRSVAAIAIAFVLGPRLPLEASTRKGDRYLEQGRKHEALREWDAALQCYQQALATDPVEMVYRMAVTKARFQAGSVHQDQGLKLRAQGQLADALAEFQKALDIDPASPVATQEVARTQAMIARERQRVLATGHETPAAERGLTPIEEARKAAEQRVDRILPVPRLHPSNPHPLNLKMNNQTARVLFETVAQAAGIRVVWDPEYQDGAGKRLNVDLQDATAEQAFDFVALVAKTSWKPLSPYTIWVGNEGRANPQE